MTGGEKARRQRMKYKLENFGHHLLNPNIGNAGFLSIHKGRWPPLWQTRRLRWKEGQPSLKGLDKEVKRV